VRAGVRASVRVLILDDDTLFFLEASWFEFELQSARIIFSSSSFSEVSNASKSEDSEDEEISIMSYDESSSSSLLSLLS